MSQRLRSDGQGAAEQAIPADRFARKIARFLIEA
jgi:hypothetical protein